MKKFFLKLYTYYIKICDFAFAEFFIGVEISAVFFAMSVILQIFPEICAVPASAAKLAGECSQCGFIIFGCSAVLTPFADLIIKNDVKQ